jgi:hypothetical protein
VYTNGASPEVSDDSIASEKTPFVQTIQGTDNQCLGVCTKYFSMAESMNLSPILSVPSIVLLLFLLERRWISLSLFVRMTLSCCSQRLWESIEFVRVSADLQLFVVSTDEGRIVEPRK